MAVSEIVVRSSDAASSIRFDKSRRTILYLGAGHPNKRQHLLPDIVDRLERLAPGSYRIVATMNESSDYARRVLTEIHTRKLSGSFENIGPVAPECVGSLVSSVDAMCLLSVLESFSNNFVESWALKKPLFVTDGTWSRDACHNGVVYIDPKKPSATADSIHQTLTSPESIQRVTEAGSAVLATHPSASQKTKLYLEVIDKVIALGPCSRISKSQIDYGKLLT
ncbi:glycosyltransferase [Novipirellula artificiosorum]|nr:glycosyltransferase [Novipirellula artificiosorum]